MKFLGVSSISPASQTQAGHVDRAETRNQQQLYDCSNRIAGSQWICQCCTALLSHMCTIYAASNAIHTYHTCLPCFCIALITGSITGCSDCWWCSYWFMSVIMSTQLSIADSLRWPISPSMPAAGLAGSKALAAGLMRLNALTPS